jgi:lipopolysaccharide export system ATP-binding protein
VSADASLPDEAPPDRTEGALTARGIVVQRAGKRLLRGVDLTLAPGTVTGVLGPSGAGKSTLFRVLVGEDRDHEGQVYLDGADVTKKPLHARARLGLGYMPQGPSVLWDLSVRENVRTFLEIARGSAEDATVRGILEATRLEPASGTRAGLLSGGERRRLELARVLAGRPRVVVCDEPFAGVDPAQAAHLGDLLADLAADGVAVVLADHHVEEALRICTSASLLLDGAIVTTGTPDAFREHPVVRGRYLGTLVAPHQA